MGGREGEEEGGKEGGKGRREEGEERKEVQVNLYLYKNASYKTQVKCDSLELEEWHCARALAALIGDLALFHSHL